MRVRSLLIRGTRYKVTYRDEVRLKGKIVDGVCDDVAKTIELDQLNTDKRLRINLLHEIVHGIVKEYRIKIGARQEEKLADAVAETMEGLFEISRKNR